jgi:hypothetical protein
MFSFTLENPAPLTGVAIADGDAKAAAASADAARRRRATLLDLKFIAVLLGA